MEAMTKTVGWDVGGAHLKAALAENGRISGIWQQPSPIWQGLEHLDKALDAILNQIDGTADSHALTMTGELADIFDNRDEGVRQLAARLSARLGPDLHIYAGPEGMLPASRAAESARLVGSANWHASAALAAAILPEALLIDMGSTTTDIVPVAGGKVLNAAYTDAERLVAGELVYQGFTRTSLMAVAQAVPFRGRQVPVMAEHFATSADAARLIGYLDEADDQMPAADGRAKTGEASRSRLARMIGLDAASGSAAEWRGLAECFAEAQLRRIQDATMLVLSRSEISPEAPLVLAGTGVPLLRRLAKRLDRGIVDFADLAGCHASLRDAASKAAPAVALALLETG